MATLTTNSKLKGVFSKLQNTQQEFQFSTDLYQSYTVICKVIEAKLSKDLSTFFSSMSVYCEVKFTNTQIEFEPRNAQSKTTVTKKSTDCETGQNPSWSDIFSFNYERLTKQGQKQMKLVLAKNNKLEPNMQQLDFTLFKKTMLFTSDKIGETTVQLHNASSGSQTDWLILTNDKEEIVGKLLAYIEIKKDTIDLKLQQGINKDLTQMPLRNHEQVHLLNERSEPLTHITH